MLHPTQCMNTLLHDAT